MFSKSTLVALLSMAASVHGEGHVSSGLPSVLVGYEPDTDVRDQARIDLDQAAIEFFLEGGNFTDYANATLMYEKGAHSKSVSAITITDATGLPGDIMQNTRMMGVNAEGGEVMVFVQGANGTMGDTTLNVQYVDEGCYVGANVVPVTTGCLASNGTLTDGSNITFSYEYDPLSTFNVYSIKGFTAPTEYKFSDNSSFTVDFQKFVDFYGSDSYADEIIMAALTGVSTDFSTGKDMDMSALDDEGRIEVIIKATSYMAIWMYVLRELEHAIYLCETGDCAEESCVGKGAVHEVDEAVAFYAGSLEGAEGSDDGVLPYRLAEKRAANFKTAGENGDSTEGTAKVNIDIIALFTQALEDINGADCKALRDDTTKIVNLMKIPLIQGTLRYTYFTAVEEDKTLKSAAEFAIFAAAVLPFVAACDEEVAELIYEQTKIGKTETDLEAIKGGFESQYECMGIDGADVGGLWDEANGMYFEGMEPMGYTGEEPEEGGSTGGGSTGGGSTGGGSTGGGSTGGGSSGGGTSGVASIRGSVAGLIGVIASVIYTVMA